MTRYQETARTAHRQIYTVSTLTTKIRDLLEGNFPFVWVNGEISNFRKPVSGHCYFTLKDRDAQISAVIFRGQLRNLKFEIEDGLNVTGIGRISVYEPRGVYQIIFEYLEPEGVGALQVAFEQLKARLASEGLFDQAHKKPLPFSPRTVAVITSPTGAVVFDILHVIGRRFPNIRIQILPVKVQGDGSETEIAAAFETVNRLSGVDVVILARGGGSLEDLRAFNSETVARAVFASTIPVVSAVGHETDFTIADFVADLRAPTPSAAAELVVPVKSELLRRCTSLTSRLESGFQKNMRSHYNRLNSITKRLIDPRRKIGDFRLRLDDHTHRLIRIIRLKISQKHQPLEWRVNRLHAANPRTRIIGFREKLTRTNSDLLSAIKIRLNEGRAAHRELAGRLHALSPTAILKRGYSITRTIPEALVVTDADSVVPAQTLEILLAKGAIQCRVEGKTDGKKNNV